MPAEDPLAALSAAARKKSAPSALPRHASAAYPKRPAVRQKKEKSMLVPLMIGIGAAVILGIVVTVIIMHQGNTASAAAAAAAAKKNQAATQAHHDPGELFNDVPTQK